MAKWKPGDALVVDVDRVTGEILVGFPRVVQSIEVILKTRLNTRIERRWWGSDFLDMMDKPQLQEVFAAGIGSACYYIDLYEPEFRVDKIAISPAYDGTSEMTVYGDYLPDAVKKSVTVRVYNSLTFQF